jgi:hypothetical protein
MIYPGEYISADLISPLKRGGGGEAAELHAFYILTADCREWSALRSSRLTPGESVSDTMKSEVLKGVNKKVTVSWDMTGCGSLHRYQSFREIPNVGTYL